MKRLAIALAAALFAPPAAAQSHLGSYTAWIGHQDLFNSNGVRLGQAAQILRQDRANVHRFGRADQGDSYDPWFADANARAALEQALMRGGIDRNSAAMIVQGGVWVQVDVYGWGNQIQAASASAYR
ncbi:MAG: hypothetical protein ACK4GT_20470 [Pararhodobacter sp.]